MGIRIGRFEHGAKIQWGVVEETNLVPLQVEYGTLRELLGQEHLGDQLEAARSTGNGIPLTEVRWLSPVTREAQIVCQGVNYAGHRQEGGYAPEKPAYNTIFTKASSTLCGPMDDIVRPAHVRLLDYEVELGVVVGRAITAPVEIDEANLHEYVAGIVISGDISARDVQIPQEQWYKGKSYRTFCPVGPYLDLLDADQFGMLDDLELRLWVNGELRQSANTSQMLFRPAETLTELSGVMDLFPGDLLMTGTPSGVALKVPRSLSSRLATAFLPASKRMEIFVQQQLEIANYLKDGDVVRATILGADRDIDLGTQENRVVGTAA